MISSNLVRINQQISFIDSIRYLSIGFLMGLTRLRNHRSARVRKTAIAPPPTFYHERLDQFLTMLNIGFISSSLLSAEYCMLC